MSRNSVLSLVAILVSLQLSGCFAPGPVLLPPEGSGTATLASETDIQIAAWNQDSRWLALAGEGLELLNFQQGRRFFLSQEKVTAITWRPDGLKVAAAERAAEGCRIRIFDLDGHSEDYSVLPGECQALYWAEAGLQILESRLQEFSFGGTFKQFLHRPGPAGELEEVLVYETTLRPAVARWFKEQKFRVGGSVLGLSGDLLIFTELRDPPAGTTYLKLMALHLPSGERWLLADLGLDARAPHLTDRGEVVSVYDGHGTVRRWGIWDRGERQAFNVTGTSYTISANGRYRWLGDRLVYDDVELMHFSDVQAAQFSPDGQSLLLSGLKENRLVYGLVPGPNVKLTPEQMAELQTLRNWRSRNLISAAEYQAYSQRALSP